ncbi:hypothetical protein ACFVYV_43460 [Streptomyces mirabilis]|uniref:hypothetical protein n=1 Tax=Streptomyces mirabilis TaxID=68239 RepID=UPI0036DD9BC6
MFGDLKFYAALATIIPLLLLNYLLGINAGKRVRELEEEKHQHNNVGCLITLGEFGPLLALLGALMGEAASLEALFENRSTVASGIVSFVGLAFLVLAGFLHLVVVWTLNAKPDENEAAACRYRGEA